jgi:predicted transcriptional regulator
LSSRAAWRLETLGFDKVFYYKPGKADWLACGLPVEKEKPEATVLDRMTKQIPTCHLNDSVSEASERAEKLGWNICPVINEKRIVLGLIREEMWKNRAGSVEQCMETAPTTLRPNYTIDDATEFLNKQGMDAVLITTSDGKLMGVLKREATAEKKQIPKSEIWA